MVTNATIYLMKPFHERALTNFDAVINAKAPSHILRLPSCLPVHEGARQMGASVRVTSGCQGSRACGPSGGSAAANSGLIGMTEAWLWKVSSTGSKPTW